MFRKRGSYKGQKKSHIAIKERNDNLDVNVVMVKKNNGKWQSLERRSVVLFYKK